jgi:hypothetical protein
LPNNALPRSLPTSGGIIFNELAGIPVIDLEKLRAESGAYSNAALVDRMIGHGDHVRAGSPVTNMTRLSRSDAFLRQVLGIKP